MLIGPEQSELGALEELAGTDEQAWIRMQGWTPLEFLVKAYRNPYVRMAERITAAKATLDYAHKRIPSALGLHQTPGQPPFMPAGTGRMDLSKLSDKELDLFVSLMNKANSNPDSEE